MNKIYVAAAGAGKTEHIVRSALGIYDPVLITTYTDENVEEIKERFYKLNGRVPNNIVILPWYSFVLKYFIQPFQNIFYPDKIKGILLIPGTSAPFTKANTVEHFFSSNHEIYSDKIGKLACKFISDFEQFPVQNLSAIFPHIFIDEMQDMADYDIDLIKYLMCGLSNVTCVCDPRQSTFKTSNGRKNKAQSGVNILNSFEDCDAEIDDTSLNINHRCHNDICVFSNSLYRSQYRETECGTNYEGEHLGLYLVRPQDVNEYLEQFHPMQLTDTIRQPYNANFKRMNIGVSKGKSFDHTLLFIPGTHIKFILTGKDTLQPKSKAILYVALTRARYSAGIVCDYKDSFSHPLIKKFR